jgi:hypothetical protein
MCTVNMKTYESIHDHIQHISEENKETIAETGYDKISGIPLHVVEPSDDMSLLEGRLPHKKATDYSSLLEERSALTNMMVKKRDTERSICLSKMIEKETNPHQIKRNDEEYSKWLANPKREIPECWRLAFIGRRTLSAET